MGAYFQRCIICHSQFIPDEDIDEDEDNIEFACMCPACRLLYLFKKNRVRLLSNN